MSLPKQLIKSFKDIKTSALVSGETTKATVQAFVDALNRAIPPSSNAISYTIYRFNRSMYIADKQKFINYIKGFDSYESMILWTDFKDILDFFNLSGKIFLGWDKTNGRYRAFIHEEPPKQVQILRRGETINDTNPLSLPLHEATKPEQIFDASLENAMEDEMARVYDHMYSRIASIEKSLANVE